MGVDLVNDDHGQASADGTEAAVRAIGDRSIAIGSNAPGIASSGDGAVNLVMHGGQVIIPPAQSYVSPAEVEPPGRLCRMPVPALQFVGRVNVLARLDRFMAQSDRGVVQSQLAVPRAGTPSRRLRVLKRSIKISASFHTEERRKSLNHAATCRVGRKTNRRDIADDLCEVDMTPADQPAADLHRRDLRRVQAVPPLRYPNPRRCSSLPGRSPRTTGELRRNWLVPDYVP